MIELSIRFTTTDENNEKGPIKVAFFRPDTGVSTAPQEFEPPLDDKTLADIHWYLETFSTWPTGQDYDRAEEIVHNLEEWGRALRDSILTDKDAARLWQQFVDARGDDRLLTLDATDSRVLRLPWELLADDGGHLFSQGIGVRRRLRQSTTPREQAALPLPVRILVVVARPDDAGFIDSRAITRPLLDAVAGLGEQVVVEFLPRPTLKALSQRLRDRSAPPVHVVHFDGHGVYDRSLGLGFLLFENDKHESDPVDANRLGTLLNQSGVPLIALNACQSAMQKEGNPYASVASRLIRAGVGSVLAMNYSVLVVAAHKFVAAFYAALAAGRTVGQAVDAGRFALLEDVERHTIVRPDASGELAEEKIRLYDWFLPALYQQNSDPVIFAAPSPLPGNAEFPGSLPTIIPAQQTYPGLVRLLALRFNLDELHLLAYELGQDYEDLAGEVKTRKVLSLVNQMERLGRLDDLIGRARLLRPAEQWDTALTPSAAAEALAPQSPISNLQSRGAAAKLPAALPPSPRHGFHGRSREMLLLDRAFHDSPLVVLHGFGGLGKTTLAAEAGRWFSRTGRFPGGAAFVSFEQGGSLEQLCSWVGQTVSGDPDWVIHGDGDLVTRVGQLLAERPALLILDNFESVLGRSPLMPPEEVAQVLEAVYQWSVNSNQYSVNQSPISNLHSPRILITTRDTTFNDARFAPSKQCRHVALGGLAELDALALAAAVLDHHAIDRAAVPRADLVALMRHLGGHPLSLNLVLPQLRQYTAQQLIDRFEELLPGFVQGKAEERNESLAVSLDFSLRRLGDETRAALPALALFQGGCMEYDLLAITGMDKELWQMARGELEQAALVTAESVLGVNVPFLRFHPTLTPYLATKLDEEQRVVLEEKYWREYYATANSLYQMDTQNPLQARAIAVRELPNLRRALDLALAAAQADPALLEQVVAFADRIASFLNDFGRWRERDGMMAVVGEQFSVIGNRSSVSGRGEAGGDQLAGSETGDTPPASPKLTKAEFLLHSGQGDTLLQQGRAAQAEALFRQLLARLQTGAAYDAAYDMAMTQVRLGRCLKAQGRPSQAIPFIQQAITGFAALAEGGKKAQGTAITDLADLYVEVGQFDEAEEQYKAALEIDKELNDLRGQGVDLGQLGTLALQRGDRAAARQRYTEALATFQRLGEPQSEAAIWHQLGRVAQEGRDWAEAERCCRESLQIKEAQRDWPGVARTCNQLAIVAQGDGRFADAERWYLRALEIDEQLDDRQGVAIDLSNLANLYLGQNLLAKAAQFARRALAIMETLDLSAQPWKTYNILAQIAAAQGDTAAARRWRRQEQESYAAYAGSSHEIREWLPIIEAVVAVCNGNQEIESQVTDVLNKYEEGWATTVAAVRQVLAGERDIENLRDSLALKGFVVVNRILQRLAGGGAPSDQIGPVSETGPISAAAAQPDPLAQLRQAWGPVVAAAVAAAQGSTEAAAQLEPVLQQLAGSSDWAALVGVLRQILSGARDAALLQGLDQTDTIIAGNILRGLGVAHPALANLPHLAPAPDEQIGPVSETGPISPDAAPEEEGISLEKLLQLVTAAARGEGPPELGVQLHAITRGLATDPNAPPELQALGRALNAILSGAREPDLAGLSPELAAAVRRVLGQI